MKITFIGLGIMGSRMAANLLKNDHDVTVWNRSKGPVDTLVQKGARGALTAQGAVREANFVLTMLSDPEAVRSVMLGKGGALKAMQPGTIWADCSTVNPAFTETEKSAAESAGVRFMDAPVAGTRPHAENAELIFFTGGDKALIEEVEPLLLKMGKKVMHIGETGKGSSYKMLVNIMLAQSMIIFSEAVLLGQAMGLDRDFLLNTIPNLVVSAPFTKFKAEMVRGGAYDVQFPLALMYKDLHLAAVTAYENEQPLYLANLARELYASAVKAGMGRLDFAAIHKFLE